MKFSTNGLAELTAGMEQLAAMPDDVVLDMLNAEAEVISEAQEQKARALGVYDTGATARSFAKGKAKRNSSGAFVTVYPRGTVKKGKKTYSLSERAFLNEFGKKGQPARPFIRMANEENADKAVDAAMKVFDNYLNSV